MSFVGVLFVVVCVVFLYVNKKFVSFFLMFFVLFLLYFMVCLKVWIKCFVSLLLDGWYGDVLMCFMLLVFKNFLNFFEVNCGLLLFIIVIGSLFLENMVFRILIVWVDVVVFIFIIFGYFEFEFIIIRNIYFKNGFVKFM